MTELQRVVSERLLNNIRKLLRSHMQLLSSLHDKLDCMSPTSLEYDALSKWLTQDRELLVSVDSELTAMYPDLGYRK